MRTLILLALSLELLSACAAKTVILPKDAATYYRHWQETEVDLLQCEADRDSCQETCTKVLPYTEDR